MNVYLELAVIVKYVSEGKVDARWHPGLGYKYDWSIVSFWIGEVERAKKPKSREPLK